MISVYAASCASKEVVVPAERDRLVEERLVDARRGRVRRVVEPQHARALEHVARDGSQIRLEVVVRRQRHEHGLAAGEDRPGLVHRVAGIRDQRDVAGVDERDRQVEDAFLRTDERLDLVVGIERHAEPLLVPRRDRLRGTRACPCTTG